MLGWSPKAKIIISEQAEYVTEGSVVTIVLQEPSPEAIVQINHLKEEIKGLTIELVHANAFEKDQLVELDPFSYCLLYTSDAADE